MKRTVWLCIFFAVLGIDLATGAITKDGNVAASRATSRKLKEDGTPPGSDEPSVNDYQPVDPSPSSKAVIPAPIEHGTPLIPYIPRPSPPNSPRSDYP